MQILFLTTIKRLWDAIGHAGRVKFLYDTVVTACCSRPPPQQRDHESDKSIYVGSCDNNPSHGSLELVFIDRAKGPIIWTFGDGPHPIFGMRGGGVERPLISTFQLTGNNRSDEPISNIDGFLRSNITNKKLSLFFQINGKYVRTIDTNGVPPHADFMIVVPFTEIRRNFKQLQSHPINFFPNM